MPDHSAASANTRGDRPCTWKPLCYTIRGKGFPQPRPNSQPMREDHSSQPNQRERITLSPANEKQLSFKLPDYFSGLFVRIFPASPFPLRSGLLSSVWETCRWFCHSVPDPQFSCQSQINPSPADKITGSFIFTVNTILYT